MMYKIYGLNVLCNITLPLIHPIMDVEHDLSFRIQLDKLDHNYNEISIKNTTSGYLLKLAYFSNILINNKENLFECSAESLESLFSTIFNIPFSVYFLLNNELLLHVSAMYYKSGLICFAGDKGEGKSTLVNLLDSDKLRLFADDTIRIDKSKCGYRAHPYIKFTNETINHFQINDVLNYKNISGKHYKFINSEEREALIRALIIIKRKNNITSFSLSKIDNIALCKSLLLQNIVGINYFDNYLLKQSRKIIDQYLLPCYLLEIPNNLYYLQEERDKLIYNICNVCSIIK